MALKTWGERARYAGAKDRAFVSGLVLDVLRRRRSLGWRMGDDSLRAASLAALHFLWAWPLERVAEAAGEAPHGPGPLTEAERAALESPRDPAEAPAAVRGDYPDWLDASLARAFGDARAGSVFSVLTRRSTGARSLSAAASSARASPKARASEASSQSG